MHVVFRHDRDVVSKNPGGGVDLECRRHGGRVGRGVFLWATFLCTSKERWLAPRRGAKALDPALAIRLDFFRFRRKRTRRKKIARQAKAEKAKGKA